MKIRPLRATRVFRPGLLLAAVTIIVIAVAALLVTDSDGIGSAKDNSPEFTVSGDGTLPTSKPKLGVGRDPLSTEEVGYAMSLAFLDASIPPNATNVRGETEPEFLYSELPEQVDAAGRKTIIVLYDYTGDETYHQLVDLKAGRVAKSQRSNKLRPPLSPDEAAAATTIAIEATPALPFTQEFEQSEGAPLLSREQVSFVAGVASCANGRCARLMLKTPAGAYLDTHEFLVNLSTQKVQGS